MKKTKKQTKLPEKKKKDDRSGLFIPAGLFIGMGLGFIFGHLVGGIFLGLGIGFLGMALSKNKKL